MDTKIRWPVGTPECACAPDPRCRCRTGLPLRVVTFQQPVLRQFDQQQFGGAAIEFQAPSDFRRIGVVVYAGVERLGLARRFEELRQLPALEDRFDFGDERRDFLAKLGVRFGCFEKVDELFVKQERKR